MSLWQNVLENNEIVIYVCDLAIGPSGQLCRVLHAETYCESHVTTHMFPLLYTCKYKWKHLWRRAKTLSRACGYGSWFQASWWAKFVHSWRNSVSSWNIPLDPSGISTSLLIDKFEELQCTNMHPTISSLSAILWASLAVLFISDASTTLRW